MSTFLPEIWHYFLKVSAATTSQLLLAFMPLLILTFLMHYLSLLNERLNYKVLGKNLYLYLFGWMGTSVHEMGHALFAILFGHKIKEMKLFKPNSENGTLGYVTHTYNPKNLYHQVGNFFIGIGPVLMCTLVLLLMCRIFYHINFFNSSGIHLSSGTFASFSEIKKLMQDIWKEILFFVYACFKGELAAWWKTVIFLYLFYSIGSSITLSPSDLKLSFKGFLIIVILLFLFNAATLWIAGFNHEWFTGIQNFMSGFYPVMILAVTVTLFFTGLLALYQFIRYLLHK